MRRPGWLVSTREMSHAARLYEDGGDDQAGEQHGCEKRQPRRRACHGQQEVARQPDNRHHHRYDQGDDGPLQEPPEHACLARHRVTSIATWYRNARDEASAFSNTA